MSRTVLDPASEDGESRHRPALGQGSHRGLLRRAAERAMQAPSVHNTQPWRMVVTSAGVEVVADTARRLDVVDPRSRQLIISCGCAVYNARVTIAAAGFEPLVTRFPDADRPDLLAVIGVGRPRAPGRAADLERAIDRRRTNRRPFVAEPLPGGVVKDLITAAREEHAGLLLIDSPDRSAVLALTAEAAAVEQADAAYRDELSSWTTDDLRRRDGVQAASVPFAAGAARRGALVRDFDTRGMGWLPEPDSCEGGDLVLLWTSTDDVGAWLRAGEALEHVWLELTTRGLWASPVGQLVEVRRTNRELRDVLRLSGYPQLLLRVGLAPETVPSRRRPASDVIAETDSSWTVP